MIRAWLAWTLCLGLVLPLGCHDDVTLPPAISNPANGNGGGGTSDAGPPMCQDPPSPLPDGALGPESCNCPCAMEAPAKLMILAQAAVAAFESKGALCTSPPSPLLIFPPPGKCYQPSQYPGADFTAGGQDSGWLCLDVASSFTKPIHCDYHYHVGSEYLAPALGGPDPGPMGFEVAAQGDVDNDGVYSTFAIAGTYDPMTGQFTLSPLFEHNPEE